MRTILIILFLGLSLASSAKSVTIKVVDQPASSVFRHLMEQTGKNFVYPSELLKDMRVSIDVRNVSLKKALTLIFDGKGIEYKIKGNNVVLKRAITKKPTRALTTRIPDPILNTTPDTSDIRTLDEVVVVSRLEKPETETAEIGARKITSEEIRSIPTLFGEADVIKAIRTLPGITEGAEGMAGMYVHGGNADENLYMLDNIPLYQVNHFAGLFSAFNPEIIRHIDFYKSSFPAKYDGRLSSFLDVRLLNGNREGHHGSAKLGLTSGSFNISGPIGKNTTYLAGIRRSWYDVLTIPLMAIINSTEDWKTRFAYHFMDLNAKVSHRFSNRANGFISVYYGDDLLQTGSEDKDYVANGWMEKDKYDMQWGNILAQAGLNYRINHNLTTELTAAYTRYFTKLKHDDTYTYRIIDDTSSYSRNIIKTDNHIDDWIIRGDFLYLPNQNSKVRFGAGYTLHSFLPARTLRKYEIDNTMETSIDSTSVYHASEINAYIEDDLSISPNFRANIGLHGSLFHIDGKLRYGVSPRVSLSWNPMRDIAFKGAYSRTTQYVHQMTESYLSLPTDQWIPVTGRFKPQTADKISFGSYWHSQEHNLSVSLEAYYKWMHNLLDFCDEYYLNPPANIWDARLTSGKGSSKGLDIRIEKSFGNLTGQVCYSLAWADRTFKEKNGGAPYPAKFDNRHTITATLNWKPNSKVTLNALWTGHSGNRFTLLTQVWNLPDFDNNGYFDDFVPLKTGINNYRLPFYHRLDLSCTVRNRRGYWDFSIYNAYCHLNTIAIYRGHRDVVEMTDAGYFSTSKPVFQKIKFLPIIPSISYTWEF